MALVFLEGFELYGSNADRASSIGTIWGGATTHTLTTQAGRYSGKSCKLRTDVSGKTGLLSSGMLKLPSAISTIVLGFAWKFESGTDGSFTRRPVIRFYASDGTSVQCQLVYYPNFATWALHRGTGETNIGTGVTWTTSDVTADANGFYYFEIKIVCGNSGSAEIRSNGSVIDSASGDTQDHASDSTIQYIKFQAGNGYGEGVHYAIDDVYVDDTDYVPAAYLSTIKGLVPDGAGNYTAWTGAYTDVDETPADGDSTVISSTSAAVIETFTFGNLASGGSDDINGAIHGVAFRCVHKETGSETPVLQIITRESSTDYDIGSTFGSTSSYAGTMRCTDANPAGGDWTATTVNSLEAGIELVSSS